MAFGFYGHPFRAERAEKAEIRRFDREVQRDELHAFRDPYLFPQAREFGSRFEAREARHGCFGGFSDHC